MLDYPIVSDVVLTKGHAATESAIKAAKKVSVQSMNAEFNFAHKHMTRFDAPVKRERVTMEVMTQQKAHANYQKYFRLMEKKNNK